MCVCLYWHPFFFFCVWCVCVCAAEQPFLCGLLSALDFINTLFCLALSQHRLKCTETLAGCSMTEKLRGCVGTPPTTATFFSWTRKLWIILILPVSTRKELVSRLGTAQICSFPDTSMVGQKRQGINTSSLFSSLFSFLFSIFFFSLAAAAWQSRRRHG